LTNVRIKYLNATVEPGTPPLSFHSYDGFFADSIVSADESGVYYEGGEMVTFGKLKDFSELQNGDGNMTSTTMLIAQARGIGSAREHKYRVNNIISYFSA
jgi:hypothetical protein